MPVFTETSDVLPHVSGISEFELYPNIQGILVQYSKRILKAFKAGIYAI